MSFITRKRVFPPAAILVALATALSQTQDQTAPPETIIRINVNLVQVDAVVTDSKGQPVTDLKAEEFEILQDGKPQKITNFAYITTLPKGSIAPAPVRPAPAVKGSPGAPPPPPAAIKPSQIRRTIAVVVDDLGLSFESIARIRESLKKFVDRDMQPGDLVAIIRTGAGMGALQQFTSDKRMLYAAIERVKYNALGRVGVSSFAPLGSEPDLGSDEANDAMARANDRRNEIFSVGTLGAIRYVVDGLHELPGRKSVILFSENLKLLNTEGMSQEVLEEVRHLTDAANRASVVIHSIDPRGLQVHGLTAADNTRGMTPEQIASVPMQRSQEEFDSRDGLVILAHDTGGTFQYNDNDIDGSLRKAIADGDGYYLIGYHPDAATFDVKTGQPKFHNVRVRVTRAGLRVRTRTGFYGTSDREQRTEVPHTRQAELQHALTSPFASGAIHVRLTTLFSNAPKIGSYLTSMLYIDANDLKFTDEPDPAHEGVTLHKAVLDVVAITFGDNGQPVDQSDRTFTLRGPDEAYKTALKAGMIYQVRHPIKKPGAYQMRIAVRDANTGQVGSASQFVEVPDVNKGRLTLSSVILKEVPPAARAGMGVAPLPAENAEGHVAEENPQGSAAVRIFKPGTPIIYGFQVLNAQSGSGKPDLEVRTRLFRDGQQVYAGHPMPLTPMNQLDPKHLVAGGSMKLGPKVAPGDYVLQVIVSDKLAKEKYRTASQWMDFEIRP